MAWNLVAWCNVPWSGSLFEMSTLSQWSHFLFSAGWASWSSGRVQDSGLGSRSSPEFNTLLVRLLVVPLSKALHAALLLSTQEQMGTCEGRFVSRGAKLRVSGCILPRELRWISRWIYGPYRPNDQGRYLSKSAEQSSEPGCGLKTVTLLYVNVTQTVPDISPLMPMHQGPLLVGYFSFKLNTKQIVT